MRRLVFGLAVASVAVLGAGVAMPAVAQNNASAAISQGFQTSETSIRAGALVSFERGNSARVELANRERVEQLAGVVSDRPLIALSSGSSETQVVTQGVTSVLVSTVNGDIKAGDKITASPINGVGMKAESSTQVIGTAQEDLSGKQTQEVTIASGDNTTRQVRVGSVLAQINVTYFAAADTAQSFLPPFLQQMANSIAGREVSVLRVVIGMLILLAGFIGAGVLLYSSVQSSIISIGRNPLSEGVVHKSLLQVGLIATAVLVVTVMASYLVLKV